jgi:hypothetical protein
MKNLVGKWVLDCFPHESRGATRVFTKQAALRLLAVCHQGDRSIDAVLHPSQANWSSLRRYYASGRQEMIRVALVDLGVESVQPMTVDLNSPPYTPKRWSFFFIWKNFVANKWRNSWIVKEEKRLFFAATLQRLWNFLEFEEQPPLDALVQLRLDLTTAASCLDQLLFGVPELALVQKVEYFAPPKAKHLFSICEVLRLSDSR